MERTQVNTLKRILTVSPDLSEAGGIFEDVESDDTNLHLKRNTHGLPGNLERRTAMGN